jgi:hypothetical protein
MSPPACRHPVQPHEDRAATGAAAVAATPGATAAAPGEEPR